MRLKLAALLCAACAARAEAATLVQTVTIDSGGRSAAVVQAHDSALGTLEAVEITLDLLAWSTLLIDDRGSPDAVTGTLASKGEVNTTLGDFAVSGSERVAVDGGGLFTGSAADSMVYRYGGAELARFLSPTRFAFDGPSFASAQFTPDPGFVASQSVYGGAGASGASARARVVFSYAASAVPEPGTWATMLIGFGAVGYALRRGRASGRWELGAA